MILTIYLIILTYFILGGIIFYYIYRNREPEIAKKNRSKFISYFLIIHILFFSIVINPIVFYYLVLFTFMVISIFDAFSQISGQLPGRNRIFQSVSPGKTIEGLISGAAIAILKSG